jgi:RsiW-degrading membrane proteinase PrsW (M82 family)
VLVYGTLALSVIVAASLVYRYDLYDREPLPSVALAILLGAATMALAGWLESGAIGRLEGGNPISLAVVAASVEEGLKLATVAVLALLGRRVFNDPIDGLIYGSMVGLGAAAEEAVEVLRARSEAGVLLPAEELVRICGHLVMGGIGGFGVGRATLRLPGWPSAVALGLVAAGSLHFGWDVLALRADAFGAGFHGDALLAAALMLAGLLLYGRLVVVASRWSGSMFAAGRPRSLAGWPFAR